MRKAVILLNSIYRRVLSLYPPHFRDLFADEMQDVFSLSVKENQNLLPLLMLIIWEGLTLPISLVKAHQDEYFRNTVLVYQGENRMLSQSKLQQFRWTITTSFSLLILFVLLGILPFFALGLHMQPADLVLGGRFDPKGFPIYGGTSYGNVFYVLTLAVMLLVPLLGSVLSIFSGVWLFKNWRKLNMQQHITGGIALMAGGSLLAFLFSPLGRIIYIWLFD